MQREFLHKVVQFPKTHAITIKCKDHPGINITENVFTEDIALTKDHSIAIQHEQNIYKPRILKHEIIGSNLIEIIFNEMMDTSQMKIFLQSKTTPEEHFDIQLSHISLNKTSLYFTTNNIPQTENIFYLLTIQNLKNQHGVFLDPNPRVVTVVFRSQFFKT